MSPATSRMNTMGAWCRPRTRMMPHRPRSGFWEPGIGARPRRLRIGEAGPARVMKASAITCGATIRDKTNRKLIGRRPLRSVAETASARAAPRAKEMALDAMPVSSVASVARIAERLVSAASAASGENWPPGDRATRTRRPRGRTSRTTTSTQTRTRRPKPPRSNGARLCRGLRLHLPGNGPHWPKISAKVVLFLVSSARAFAASKLMTLMDSRAG